MKNYKKIVLVLLGTFSLVYADISVDTQIQAIKNAPASERAQMMNELKIRLSSMNSQDRNDAITQLRTQMHSQNNVQEHNTHTQSAHADSMQQIQTIQQMDQQQAGTQYMMESHPEIINQMPGSNPGIDINNH